MKSIKKPSTMPIKRVAKRIDGKNLKELLLLLGNPNKYDKHLFN